jgi:hypothetical protein
MAGLTVIGDAHLVPDPEAITEAFNHEFQKMLKNLGAPEAPAKKPAARKAPPRKTAQSTATVRRARLKAA